MATGEFDPLNPLEDAEAVFEALAGPKEMWVFEDEFHPTIAEGPCRQALIPVRRRVRTITERRETMTRNPPTRALPPMHPGELLCEDILPAVAESKTEIARLLGISRQTLYDILDERQPVTPRTALRLGKLFGNGPELWLNLQRRYDLWQAEQELGDEIASMPTIRAA